MDYLYNEGIAIVIFGYPAWKWLLASAIVCLFYFFSTFVKNFAEKKLHDFSKKTDTNIDDYLYEILSSVSRIFIFTFSLYLGVTLVGVGKNVHEAISNLFLLIFFWQVAKWAILISKILFTRYKEHKTDQADMHAVSAINGLTALTRFIIWTIFLMLALDNLGVDITALVAGLGIGGLAIALAAQSILGDLFASLTIMIDKPIAIGDYVVVDNFMGNVKAIGIKSTKLESITGEEIIISNSDLLNSRLRNYHQSRMKQRRSSIKIGIVYETDFNKLKKVQDILKEIVKSNPQTEYIRAVFVNFGDFSLDFELTYNVLSPDYETLTEINHEIRLKIFETFEKEKLQFAYPTRTLHITKNTN
jgi:small-conductance mechanosensitive channel